MAIEISSFTDNSLTRENKVKVGQALELLLEAFAGETFPTALGHRGNLAEAGSHLAVFVFSKEDDQATDSLEKLMENLGLPAKIRRH